MVSRPLLEALAADPRKALADIAAERARRRAVAAGKWTFAQFAQNAWPVVDQAPVVWGWYLDALALHLEMAARRKIRRLVGSGPPRNGKSNLFAIMWPAWVWTWAPSTKFIYLSYSDDLVQEHSIKCRALIESPWYQDTFRPQWRLGHGKRSDHGEPWRHAHGNRQDDFVNSAGGRRIASPISASVVGRGADIIAVDDPLGFGKGQSESAAARDHAREAITQAVATRFNDPATGVAVLLAQRLHVEDPSRTFIDRGWSHFCTPFEFDPARRGRTTTDDGQELWVDPRTEEGESLEPRRWTPELVRIARGSLPPVHYAAQFQQAPLAHAYAGKYFNQATSVGPLRFLPARPLNVVRRVRSWDLASTEGGGDWTVGVLIAQLEDGTLVVEDVRRGQWGPREVRAQVKATARSDGKDVEITIPKDPAQAGKDQVQGYVTMLFGWSVFPRPPTQNKELRAGPASAQWMAGNIAVVQAPWNEPFLCVLESFPDPDVHDDDVDALSDGVGHLSGPLTTADVWAGAAPQTEPEEEEGTWWQGT